MRSAACFDGQACREAREGKKLLEALFEIREMNFVIEVYSALMCAVGTVCLYIMLPRGANRRFVLQFYACCLLMCLGDAVAAMGRGQECDSLGSDPKLSHYFSEG